jgi:superfamily I DNA and RNA helicase
VVSALKKEMHEKYSMKLVDLKSQIQTMQVQFEKSQKCEQLQVKALHQQHLKEKAGVKEQFEFIYQKYKDKKEEFKQLQKQCEHLGKQIEKERRHRENQRKIYEKMFTEGMKLQDVKIVMDKYMERESMKNST